MNFLFIHGRDQQDQSPEVLKQQWTDALMSGFVAAGLTFPQDAVTSLPYFGDLLFQLNEEHNKENDGKYNLRGAANNKSNRFIGEYLEEMWSGTDIDTAQIPGDPEELDLNERGWMNSRLIRLLSRGLDHFRWAGNKSISSFATDVAAYLTDPLIRFQIHEVVIGALGKEPTIIIAHSLGSIIAYNVLGELNKSSTTIMGLITLGSPLGVHAVQRQLAFPLKWPDCIRTRWYNFYDNRDIVALHALTGKHFDITPTVINQVVINNSANRHHIEEYLNKPEIVLAIQSIIGTGLEAKKDC